MSHFSRVSRRKFLSTAALSATSAIFLKGCLGNPPSRTGGAAKATASEEVKAIEISMEDPEYYKLRNYALDFLYNRFAHDDVA